MRIEDLAGVVDVVATLRPLGDCPGPAAEVGRANVAVEPNDVLLTVLADDGVALVRIAPDDARAAERLSVVTGIAAGAVQRVIDGARRLERQAVLT